MNCNECYEKPWYIRDVYNVQPYRKAEKAYLSGLMFTEGEREKKEIHGDLKSLTPDPSPKERGMLVVIMCFAL